MHKSKSRVPPDDSVLVRPAKNFNHFIIAKDNVTMEADFYIELNEHENMLLYI